MVWNEIMLFASLKTPEKPEERGEKTETRLAATARCVSDVNSLSINFSSA